MASTAKQPEDPKASSCGTDDAKAGGTSAAASCSAAEGMELVEATREESNTSSAVIELAAMWFNFAAPPRTPITRKIDYTRYSFRKILS